MYLKEDAKENSEISLLLTIIVQDLLSIGYYEGIDFPVASQLMNSISITLIQSLKIGIKGENQQDSQEVQEE